MRFLLIVFLFPVPAFAGPISILGPLAHDVNILPGQTHHGAIIVRNDSAEPVDLVVYQTDYRFFADGSNHYPEPGSLDRSNAGWISYAPPQFTLASGAKHAIAWQVTAPHEETLRGTYWSILMVEPVGSRFQPHSASPGLHVAAAIRYGVQIATTIGSQGSYDLVFDELSAAWKGAEASLHLELENTGEMKLSPSVWVEIFDLRGGSMGRFGGNRKRIYPACSAAFDIPLPALAEGRYTALIVVDNGDDHVFGSQLTLRIR
ncbi:MAG: hypothetical protein GF355_11210 [Candidatus Eisenbacteria bacterium]|nr:hypothetical protein [Candidatus Eisenbacteria bacterium]